MSLYPILQEHLTLLQEIEQAEGEISDEQLAAFELNGIEIERNAVSLGFGIKALEDKEAIIKKEIDRLKSLCDATAKKKERIKDFLSKGMQVAGITEIKGDTLKLSFRKSESVEVDEAYLPEDWKVVKTTTAPDKNRIKAALKAGEVVPGAKLITNNNLQIK